MTKFELIDKNALIRKFCAECQHCYRVDKAGGEPTMCKTVMMIAEMPTIEPEVRHGRWIPTEYDSYADGAPVWDKWECSECGHEHSGEEDTLTAFCPDCGSINLEV